LVLQRLHELGDPSGPLSARRASERSRGRISYEQIRRIARGLHNGRLTERSIEGLALALDVPLSRVEQALDGYERPTLGEWVMPERLWRLDEVQRRAVEAIAVQIFEAQERAKHGAGTRGRPAAL